MSASQEATVAPRVALRRLSQELTITAISASHFANRFTMVSLPQPLRGLARCAEAPGRPPPQEVTPHGPIEASAPKLDFSSFLNHSSIGCHVRRRRLNHCPRKDEYLFALVDRDGEVDTE